MAADEPLPDFLDEAVRPWPLPLRVVCATLGSLCLMIGVAGVLLPVLPGVPFLLAAAWLLGKSSADLRRRVNGMERRLPSWLRRALRPRRRRTPPLA